MRHLRVGPDQDMYNWRFQPVRVRRDCDGEWVNENVAGTFVNIESELFANALRREFIGVPVNPCSGNFQKTS